MAYFEGRDPASGEMLRLRAVHITGWDVTHSPPKSVSVLHAAGDPRIAAGTLGAHRAAVRSALGYLELDACWTRRGAGGTRRLVGEGFVAAEYVHPVSRAGDAQLHFHVVIANMTRADGRWTTLDGQALYANLKTAFAALYHAELRAELTRRLGVEWEPVAPGKLEQYGAVVLRIPRLSCVLYGFPGAAPAPTRPPIAASAQPELGVIQRGRGLEVRVERLGRPASSSGRRRGSYSR